MIRRGKIDIRLPSLQVDGSMGKLRSFQPSTFRRGRRGQDMKVSNNAKRNLWLKSPKICDLLNEAKEKNVAIVSKCKMIGETSWTISFASFNVFPLYEHKRPGIKDEYILGNKNTKRQLTEDKGGVSCEGKMNNDTNTFGGASEVDFWGKIVEVSNTIEEY